MKDVSASVLAINAGSSSIRFALYEPAERPRRLLDGKMDRIGLKGTHLIVNDSGTGPQAPLPVVAANHGTAVRLLLDWLEARSVFSSLEAVGHRLVHGMQHSEPERITPRLLGELRRMTPYAPEHLPREIGLIEAFLPRRPKLPQVACFDTAFHRTMPSVAKRLPIPRRYGARGMSGTASTGSPMRT